MSNYPVQIAGRVTEETGAQIKIAEEKFGVKEGTLVRMALEDYMPRYLGENKEFIAKLSAAVDLDPELKAGIERLIKKSQRATASAAS